jgi:hypothetical protein
MDGISKRLIKIKNADVFEVLLQLLEGLFLTLFYLFYLFKLLDCWFKSKRVQDFVLFGGFVCAV